MTDPNDRDLLHAYADGQLDRAQVDQVERWLERCPDDARLVAEIRRQNALLRQAFDPIALEPIPRELLKRTRSQPFTLGLRLAASIGFLALGILLGWWGRGIQDPIPASAGANVADDALAAHRVFVADIRHPVEVGGNDQAHLVAWLSKRLDRKLIVPDFGYAHYALLGGRLLPSEQGAAAQFMYEAVDGQRLTLYVRHVEGGRDTAFQFADQKGENAFYWMDQGFGYALVGALPRPQLADLAKSAYHQMTP